MSEKTLKDIERKTTPIFHSYGVLRAGLFGSAARGEDKKESDYDFLVEFGPKATLFTLGGLKYDLEKTLKREVDVVSTGAVKQSISKNIEKDLINFYEKR